jgi:DNA end-binding protein Ku
LEAAQPERTRGIAIEDFVELADVDPIFFQKTYYLDPGPGAEKPYALLLRAMAETGRVGIARFVFRTKEHLAAIRPMDGLLVLETMFFADEVRDVGDIDGVPAQADLDQREVDMATQLIGSMTNDWKPERYEDTHRERVLELIERKASGGRVVVEEAPAPGRVQDLMAALRASVEQAKQGRSRAGAGEAGGREPTDLAGWSRDRLYEEAQRRQIRGRSQMSKDELVEAIRRAS